MQEFVQPVLLKFNLGKPSLHFFLNREILAF